MAVIDLEQSPSSTVSKDHDEMMDNPLEAEPTLQEVSTSGAPKRETLASIRGERSEVEVSTIALDEVTTWMVGQLGD